MQCLHYFECLLFLTLQFVIYQRLVCPRTPNVFQFNLIWTRTWLQILLHSQTSYNKIVYFLFLITVTDGNQNCIILSSSEFILNSTYFKHQICSLQTVLILRGNTINQRLLSVTDIVVTFYIYLYIYAFVLLLHNKYKFVYICFSYI